MLSSFLTAAAAVFVYMAALFLLAQALGNNSLVDIGWGFGFIVVVSALFIRAPVLSPSKVLMASCIVMWGLRLSIHIFRRNAGQPEDFRYAAMRKKWGKGAAVKSFFFIFMLQGLVMLAVSFPATVLFGSPARPLSVPDIAGALIFLTGFLFETVGDAQLAAHVRDPRNKGTLMTRGLWSITRHPNYFGECVLWLGIGFIALSSPFGWASLVGPVTITVLLLFVSGVPLLEKRFAGRPDWEEYKKRTPKFFPRLPLSNLFRDQS
jgi:steroid 5-alpha reductase family enzyme